MRTLAPAAPKQTLGTSATGRKRKLECAPKADARAVTAGPAAAVLMRQDFGDHEGCDAQGRHSRGAGSPKVVERRVGYLQGR